MAIALALLGRAGRAESPLPQPAAVASLPQQTTEADAESALLNQGFFWASRDPRQAAASFDRVLRFAADNATALAMLTQLMIDQNLPEVAKALLRRLQAAHPDDPHLSELEESLRAGPVDLALLAQARRLASSGKAAAALDTYRAAFRRATPPAIYAGEYFITMQGIDGRWDDAQAGLAAALKDFPEDLSLKLDYAKLLSYNEATRADAIDMLQDLAGDSLTAEAARKAWHDALLWQADEYRAQEQLFSYLARYPSDADLDAKRAEFSRTLPDDGARARWTGYQAMEDKNTAEAERQFLAALAFNAADVDAMIALATIRQQQGRLAESSRLTEAAIALAPGRRDEIEKLMRTGTTDGTRIGELYRAQSARMDQLIQDGDYAGAEAVLRRLAGDRRTASFYVQLAGIQTRAGQDAAAEANLRQALVLDPRDLAARRALARLQSNRLRDQAAATTDAIAKEDLFRQAIAADPSNPWPRLQLASLLQEQHRGAEADAVMAKIPAGPKPDSDAIQAALIWADKRNDLARAAGLLVLLPARDRTTQTQRVSERVTVNDEIDRTMATDDRSAWRDQLLSVAARPDPDGLRGVAVATAFGRMHDRAGAQAAIVAALAATPAPSVDQRLSYTNVLVKGGDLAFARTVFLQIEPQDLTLAQAQTYHGLETGFAINQADVLSLQGRQVAAVQVLTPHLRADPDSTPLNLAMARIYQTEGRSHDALLVSERVMLREPNDLDARRAAVAAAVSAAEWGRADRITAEALKASPDDPRPYLMLAALDRARGRNQDSLEALRRARLLRERQLAQADDVP